MFAVLTKQETETLTQRLAKLVEKYQHLSPAFRAQAVDLMAQVLFSGTSTDTPGSGEIDEKEDDSETLIPEVRIGGVDGTRTRDLRRDRPAF